MSSRYQRLEKIAQGGRGIIWKAQDAQSGQIVALKEASSSAAEADLSREIEILSSLHHPHIAQFFEAETQAGKATLIMEWISGETLEERVLRQPLIQEEFSLFARQSLSALAALHQQQWLHHDLQPQNFIGHAGSWSLIDFGSARPLAETSVAALIGHVHCIAPERFSQSALDARSDLYALGCVFYFALTGEYPFAGDTSAQIITAHLHAEARPLQATRPDISSSLCQLIHQMIARNPAERPASAAEILDQLSVYSQLALPVDTTSTSARLRPLTEHGEVAKW